MFHVISISIFWLYQVPLYLILLYQFPDIGYIRFRYIKVCHISFHFCHIRFCYIKFQFGYIRFVISDSVISKSVISKGPSPTLSGNGCQPFRREILNSVAALGPRNFSTHSPRCREILPRGEKFHLFLRRRTSAAWYGRLRALTQKAAHLTQRDARRQDDVRRDCGGKLK